VPTARPGIGQGKITRPTLELLDVLEAGLQ
jgi:hypothetical protein